MKLHLGCGQVYMKGYVNIDYPLDKHSVQKTSVADEFADLTKLRYPPGTVDEVRLHHVFEHFRRPTAAALLASWRSWLKPGGVVHIEVPDFNRTARNVLNPFSSKKAKAVGLRHIFGSNEADWAVHYHGWSPSRLKELVRMLGFEVVKTETSSYMGTFNCTIIAKKTNEIISQQEALMRVEKYLKQFLVNESDAGEKELLKIWVNEAKKQLKATWAKQR